MSIKPGLKVKLLRLHQAVHINGAGELGSVLPTQKKNFARFEMETHEYGVLITVNNEVGIVPWANISIATLDGYEKPAVAAVKAVA